MDLFKEVRQNEPRLRALLQKYEQECPVKEGSKKRGAFNIVRYIEVHEAAAGTILDDAGILMRKTRFVAHAQTHDYVLGKLSELEADARWEEMKAEAELGKRPTDNDGPPKEPLRAFHVLILFCVFAFGLLLA